MKAQILSSIWNASSQHCACTCIGVSVPMCYHVQGGERGRGVGGANQLWLVDLEQSGSESRAELWFYSQMFVNNIYNRVRRDERRPRKQQQRLKSGSVRSKAAKDDTQPFQHNRHAAHFHPPLPWNRKMDFTQCCCADSKSVRFLQCNLMAWNTWRWQWDLLFFKSYDCWRSVHLRDERPDSSSSVTQYNKQGIISPQICFSSSATWREVQRRH